MTTTIGHFVQYSHVSQGPKMLFHNKPPAGKCWLLHRTMVYKGRILILVVPWPIILKLGGEPSKMYFGGVYHNMERLDASPLSILASIHNWRHYSWEACRALANMRGITRCLELRGDLKDIQQYLQMVDRKLCLHTEKAKDVERMDGLVGCPMEAMGESHVSCKFLSLFLGFLFFDCLPSLYSQNGTRMLFMFCRQGLPTLF